MLKKLISGTKYQDLTNRDLEIIRIVRDLQIVSRSQIQIMFFPTKQSLNICNRRLAKIEKLGFINRTPITLNGESLITAGKLLIQAGGTYISKLPSDYTHQLLINEIYALMFREQNLNKIFIKQYKPEFVYKFLDREERKQYILRSDILTVLEKNGIDTALLFEIDAGTESKKQLREKINIYEKVSMKVKNFPQLFWLANDLGFKKLISLDKEINIAKVEELRENFYIWTKYPDIKKVRLIPDIIVWKI
jgi:hypothetical protein